MRSIAFKQIEADGTTDNKQSVRTSSNVVLV